MPRKEPSAYRTTQMLVKKVYKIVGLISDLDMIGLSKKEENDDLVEVKKLAIYCVEGNLERLRDSLKRTKRVPPPEDWATKLAPAVLVKILDVINGDGHTIFLPGAFIKAGLSRKVVDWFTEVYPTGMEPTSVLTNETGIIPFVRGIYGLDLLRVIAGKFSVYSTALGRGFEARELTEKIKEKLNV